MREGIDEAIAQLHAAVDSLRAFPLDSLADDDLVDVVRAAEAAVRSIAPVQHELVAEVDRRGLAHAHSCSTTAALLGQLLRLSTSEAKARVKAADRFASRRAVSGELLEPLLPATAAAQASGEISARHAAVIGDAIDRLPRRWTRPVRSPASRPSSSNKPGSSRPTR